MSLFANQLITRTVLNQTKITNTYNQLINCEQNAP